jgi:hypothetical protein
MYVRKNQIKQYLVKKGLRIGIDTLWSLAWSITGFIRDTFLAEVRDNVDTRVTIKDIEELTDEYKEKKYPEEMDTITWTYKGGVEVPNWVYKKDMRTYFTMNGIQISHATLDKIVKVADIIIKRKVNHLLKILPRKSTGALYRKTIKEENIKSIF